MVDISFFLSSETVWLSGNWLRGDLPWWISSETVCLSGNVTLCFPVLIRRSTMSECSIDATVTKGIAP